jgi:hypothetical protein
MSDMKSQFRGYSEGNYLMDSLAVIGADTRKGPDSTTATRLAAMQGYVNAHPEKTNAESFKAYVGKLTSGAPDEAKPMVVAARKPGTGFM